MQDTERLSLKTKIGYALGDFGGSIPFQSVTLFIVFYFTDVFGLSAAAAGLIFAIAKLWNAVCDPAIGSFSDRLQTRWGQKRPFLLFGAVPFGISFFLLVAAPQIEAKFAYALVTFLLFSTAYSIVSVPYGAITASISSSPEERSSLTAYRMAFAILAILFVGGATRPIVDAFDTPQEGFRFVGLLYGVMAAIFTIVTFATTYERSRVTIVEHLGFIERLRIVKSNVPFLLLNGAIIVHLAAITVVATIVNYYFKYNLRSEALTPVAFVGLFVAAALTLPLWLKLEKKIGRKATFNAGMALLSLMLVPLLLIENPNPYVVIAVMIVAGAGMSTIYVFPWSMVPSTIDYSEWKTGQRHEGLFYGFFYFSFKAAAALGGLLAGLGLDLAGYSASAGESGTLGDGTLTGIRILLTALPIALMMAGIAFVHFYPIDEAMERQFRDS